MQSLYICDDCRRSISYLEPPLCDKCGHPVEDGDCQECGRTRFAFTAARAVGVYEGVLREAIHALKYSGKTVVAPELSRMLCERMDASPDFAPDISVVIPVPIHPSRRSERGFNQSELLARSVAERLDTPLETQALIRSRPTRPQVELPVDMRRGNVRGVFKVTDASRVYERRILLVDDVMTTGSTANEASKVLRASGAEAVFVLTLARSLLSRDIW